MLDIERMILREVLEPAQREWASHIVFALKTDGLLHFCVNYRKLNAVTNQLAYPIPCEGECIDPLVKEMIFSIFD